MINFEFKRKDDSILRVLNETFVNKMRKTGTTHWQNQEINVITPLTELRPGAVLRFRYNNTGFIDELELVGCYIDLDTHNLYTELGIDMPFKRIF